MGDLTDRIRLVADSLVSLDDALLVNHAAAKIEDQADEIERLRGLIDEAASCIEGLAGQQEMPDPFWVPVLKALTDQKEK